MTMPPAPGLPDRLRDGSASEADRSWAVRRLGILREDATVIGLTAEQQLEMGALSEALEGQAHG